MAWRTAKIKLCATYPGSTGEAQMICLRKQGCGPEEMAQWVRCLLCNMRTWVWTPASIQEKKNSMSRCANDPSARLVYIEASLRFAGQPVQPYQWASVRDSILANKVETDLGKMHHLGLWPPWMHTYIHRVPVDVHTPNAVAWAYSSA